MRVRLPRLLDSNMNEVRRIRPLDGSLFLNITPLSTASLTLETEQMIPVRSYVEMYNAYGSVGIFRVRTAGNTYGATSSTVELEHAICEVGDYICTTELNKSATLNSAISELFAFYKGSKWRLGTISATDNVVVDISYDNVLEAILGLLEQAPEYMLTFDFSSRPWTINLARRGTTVSAEGRLGRNVQNASVSYDDSEVCTRAYIGWDNSKGKTTIVHYDADTMAQYGLIEKHLSGSGYTEAQARIVAQTYLKYHKKPKVAITITGYDFYNATGESLDRLDVGKLYRLALPKYSVTVEENITGLAWPHLYSEPDNVEITLADVEDPVVAFVRKTQKSSSGNSKAIVKKDKEYWTKFDQTDYYMDLMAVHVDKQGNILEQAGMYLDSQGVLIYADNLPNQVGSRFKVQADAINAEVRRATEAEGTLSGRLTVESDRITAEVTRATTAEGTLSGRITVEAGKITQEVTRATTAEGTLSGRITTEADRISLVVEGTGANAKIKPASIVSAINNGESSVIISADHINLDGYVKATDITADLIKTKISQIGTLSVGYVSVGSGKSITLNGTSSVELSYASVIGIIKDLRITQSGNTYTLQKKNFNGGTNDWVNVGTFSRAVSSWDWTGGNGKVKVTAQPQNQTLGVDVRVNGNATITLNGTYTYKAQYEDDNGSYWDIGGEGTKTITVDVPALAPSDIGIYDANSVIIPSQTISPGNSIDLWAGCNIGQTGEAWGSKVTITAGTYPSRTMRCSGKEQTYPGSSTYKYTFTIEGNYSFSQGSNYTFYRTGWS